MSASNAIVVASAARTPVGSFNGAFANTPAHELGVVVIKEVLARAGVDGEEVDEVILGQVLTAGAGPEPGAPGVDRRRPAEGDDRLGPQPGLRLGPARRRARHAADRDRRRQDHRRRRPGIDVAGAALRSICAPASRWATCKMIDTMIKDGLMGRLQRLPHGQHRRERRPPVADHPRRAGRVRASPRRTRPRPRRRPASSRTRSSPSPSRAARATPSSTRTNISATARRSMRCRS